MPKTLEEIGVHAIEMHRDNPSKLNANLDSEHKWELRNRHGATLGFVYCRETAEALNKLQSDSAGPLGNCQEDDTAIETGG